MDPNLEYSLNLYHNLVPIQKLKRQPTEEYLAFSAIKGPPPVLGDFNTHARFIDQDLISFDFDSNPIFWMIPLSTPSEQIYGFVFKSFAKKYFRSWRVPSPLGPAFGFSQFGDYQFDKPIILTEGIKDAAWVQLFYPYVLAGLTSAISKTIVQFVSSVTNKVVLALDNDDAGDTATEALRAAFRKSGVKVLVLKPIRKDFGNYFGSETLKERFPVILTQLLDSFS